MQESDYNNGQMKFQDKERNKATIRGDGQWKEVRQLQLSWRNCWNGNSRVSDLEGWEVVGRGWDIWDEDFGGGIVFHNGEIWDITRGVGGRGGVKRKTNQWNGMNGSTWLKMPWVLLVLQNKIVDQCERLQLQSAGITKYMAEVLPGKNQRAVVGNSSLSPSVLGPLLG